MAHSSQLIQWFLNEAENLNLQATQFDWVSDWGLDGYFDMQVTIEVDGIFATGRGTAGSEDLAFIKAGAEAIERATCTANLVPSLGVAAHTSALDAQNRAISELQERNAFFSHFYSKTPFTPVPQSVRTTIRSTFPKAFSKLLKSGVALDFFQARSPLPIVICVSQGAEAERPFGGIVGLACDSAGFGSAALSAFIECLRNVAPTLVDDEPLNLCLSEFNSIREPTPHDRQRLSKDLNYWREVKHLFPTGEDSTMSFAAAAPDLNVVTSRLLTLPFSEPTEAPICVAKADFAQQEPPLFPRDHTPTTRTHIQNFLGHPFSDNDLQHLPHFLG